MLERWWRTTAFCVLALLACAPGASAAQRFAAPDGSGDCSTAPTACSYEEAIGGASDGDEVILAPGDYGTAVSPRPAGAYSYQRLDVHGAAGQPRPRIFSSAPFPLGLENVGSTISRVDIERVATNAGAALVFHGTLAEDLVVTDAGGAGSAACQLNGTVTLRNSRCWENGGTGGAGTVVNTSFPGGPSAITLRNVTTIAGGAGSAGLSVRSVTGVNAVVTAVNSIFEGSVDIAANEGAGGDAIVNATYSAFQTNQQDPGAEINGDATDVLSRPAFVDFPGGDFHQAADSSTVDKGVDDPLNGTTDWDGQPRTAGARTDIGVDEHVPPATEPGPVAPAAPAAGAPAPAPAVKPPAGSIRGVKAADLVTLPSAKACVSRRRFRIRLRARKGVTIRSATVRVNGSRVKVVKGRALTAPVDLRGLPKRRFTVKVTIVTGAGRGLTLSRRYRACAPKRR